MHDRTNKIFPCRFLVKELETVDPFVLVALRGIVICCLTFPFLAYYRITPFPEGKMKALIIRGISFVLFMTPLFYGFRWATTN